MAYRSNRGYLFLNIFNCFFLIQASPSGQNSNFLLEQQNDCMVDELSNKVSQLKRVTIAIGDDVREQNKLLNEMVNLFII